MPTPNQIVAHARAWIDVANHIKSAYVLAKQVSAYNSVTDPGWGSLDDDPPVATATGIIDGTEVTPGDISNAIGSINNFLAFLDGTAQPAQSAWIQNIEKIAKPIV